MTPSNERSVEQWEELAEAIVFAHDPAVAIAPEDADTAALEHTAAVITAAMVVAAPAIAEPVPDHLLARLSATGHQHCTARATDKARDGRPRILPEPAAQPANDLARPTGTNAVAAFFVGIAATALVWLGAHFATSNASNTTPALPVIEQRAGLLRENSTRTIDWQRGPSPLSGQVQGDVVWNDTEQAGFLTFRGLPPLDSEHRFQLWIVDANRPGSAPVDGGLFAIQDANRTETFRIDPKLPVGKAAAFVITVEERAGAVVSKQEHVVATAGL